MLNLKELRENPGLFKSDLFKRGLAGRVGVVDRILLLDKKHRGLLGNVQVLRERRNSLSREIDLLKSGGEPVDGLLLEARSIPLKLKQLENESMQVFAELEGLLFSLPNLLHESVPVGKTDADNVVLRSFLKPKKFDFVLRHHGELAVFLGCADFERAVKISGSGFFYLKNELALLDFALQQLAIKLLLSKGFSLVEVPFLVKRVPYEGVTDFSDFESLMYKIEGSDLFLIATSEHSIAPMFMNEVLDESFLPQKFCGVSACFRKEVGKHGLDERGLFRVHQFNKVEQFVFCAPQDSWRVLEELVLNAEDFLKKLGIPFQVVSVCSGDIGFVAAKKYDVNGWSPRENKFIELMSVSNCTAYQSSRLGIKMRLKNGGKEFVHTLNGTMVATSRLIRLVLENFQAKNGTVSIPKVLWPFIGGIKEIKPLAK